MQKLVPAGACLLVCKFADVETMGRSHLGTIHQLVHKSTISECCHCGGMFVETGDAHQVEMTPHSSMEKESLLTLLFYALCLLSKCLPLMPLAFLPIQYAQLDGNTRLALADLEKVSSLRPASLDRIKS